MNGDSLRVMGSMNIHSSNGSQEFQKGAVLSVSQSSQDPGTPLWNKHKETKKKNQEVWKHMTGLTYLKYVPISKTKT